MTSKFRLEGGVGYEEGKITEAEILKTGAVIGFPVGSPLSNVPKWTASLRGEYVSPTSFGDYFVRPEYNFVGSSLSLANGGAGLIERNTASWTFAPGCVPRSGGSRFLRRTCSTERRTSATSSPLSGQFQGKVVWLSNSRAPSAWKSTRVFGPFK